MINNSDELTPKIPFGKSGIWYLLLAIFAIGVDYWSKSWIVQNVQAYDSKSFITVIDGFFNIVHVHNKGAAFSFLADHSGWQQWFFAGLAVVISLLLTYWLVKTSAKAWWRCSAYALIIGGALGNLYDRLVYGHVVDFLDFYITYDNAIHHYPAFNIADCAICVGVFMVVVCELFFTRKK